MENKKDDQPNEQNILGHQKAIDTAINERIKEEQDSDKIEPEQANRPDRRSRKTDVSEKSAGGGKQSNPGD